ncbi:hypothetical protein DV736_g5879, partial [Chaetothyriales sp. CBS 134916]
MYDMQLYKQSMVPGPSISKDKYPRWREEQATTRLNTRPTKRHRTEVDHSVHHQQNIRPITDLTQFNIQNIDASPITNENFHMHSAAIVDADMESKRPRSADMCGQFEDIVGTLPPHRRRSSRTLSYMLAAPPEIRENTFFDFNRYNEEQIFHSRHQIPNHTFTTSASMTMRDTNQSTTNAEPSTGDSWKELAEIALAGKHTMGPGNATQLMITRMNELWPLSRAEGIFDNGCGTGAILSHILEHYGAEIPPSAWILAADFSDHLLEVVRKTKQAKSEITGKNAWDRVEIRNLDAQDLSSIPDDSVSHLTGGMLYFMLPDARKALKETNRVLCPGGIVALSSGKSSEHIDALGEAVEKIRPGTHLTLLSGAWASEVGVKEELEATGFVDVETHLVASSMSYQSHQQLAEMLLQMPVMKNVVDGFSEEEKNGLLQGTVDNLKAINPAEPGTLKGVTIAALGHKPGATMYTGL